MQFFGQLFTCAIRRYSLGWLTSGALLLWAASSSPANASVSIVRQDFNESTAYGWTVGGSGVHCLTARGSSLAGSIPNCGSPADTPGSGVLRLTDATNGKQAFVFYNYAIPSNKGLVITFDYYSYGGDPTGIGVPGADGTTFFLFDGSTDSRTAVPGADGGALGYAQRDVNGQTRPGLTNAYVGVGLDEFGNFANDYEGRGESCPNHPPSNFTPSFGAIIAPPGSQTPNSVTVRGPGNGTTRYCLITNSGNLSVGAGGFRLYNPLASARTAPNTNRTVRITLGTDNTIKVEIDPTGTRTAYQTIFASLQAPGGRPSSFKFGFASSTGDFVNNHEIQRFQVETIDTPPLPDLTVTKSHTGNFSEGGTGTYTLRVQNLPTATGPTYGPVVIRDTLPAGFSFVSGTGNNWNCSADGQQVTCVYDGPAVNPGGFLPDLTLNVNVTANPGNYTNTAQVSTEGDSNSANDTATDQTIVVGPVVANKTVSDLNGLNNGNAKSGDILQYTVTISNNSLNPATGVTFQDAIPANTTYIAGSTQLNGTDAPDVNGTMPFVNATALNSPGEPPGQINPNKAATVTFRVQINNPLPSSVTQILNQGTISSNNFPPTPTNDVNSPTPGTPTTVPVVSSTSTQPNLRLVKRITSVTRGGVLLGGVNLTSFFDDPNDQNDNAPGWAQLSPVGVFRLGPETPLQSGDEVEYTTYFLSDGSGPVNNFKFCDLIPSGTAFVPNSILATIATVPVGGNFLSPLAPLPGGNACSNQTNPDGAVIVNLGNVSNAVGSNFGFIRFRVRIK